MFDKESELNLSELIDVNFLQKFQDAFAQTMGVASITVDNKGPITKPSNFTDFCIKLTRSTAEGYNRCNACDIKWGKLAAIKGEPVIYDCHSGLTDFAVPIIVDGQHIGSILGGQVLTKEPNEEHFRKIAREIGLDENEYIGALKKIKIVPPEHVKGAADLLFLVANAISEIGLQNLKLIKKNNRDNLYKQIMETIRSSIDINETSQRIVDIIGKTLKADRCFIMEYHKNSAEFLIVKDEYLSSGNIEPYLGTDTNTDVPNFIEEFKKGNYLVVDNKKIFINDKPQSYDIEDETIKRVKVNSAYGIPLFWNNELQGVLGIHYITKKHSTSHDELDLLRDIAEQLAISVYQAKMYEDMQEHAERETVYRRIIETIRSSIDIGETKKQIVAIMCKTLDADRCFIIDYDKERDKFLPVKDEYLSSDEIKSYVGGDPNIDLPTFAAELKNGKPILIINKEIPLEAKGIDFAPEIAMIDKLGINSVYSVPLYYGEDFQGVLSIHYVREHNIGDEEINLLNTIANQTAIAIYQAKLYKMTQVNAEREKVIASVVSKIISTFDINQIKQMVSDIGIIMQADRCYFVEVDPEEMKGLPLNYEEEYLSSPDVKSVVGYDFPAEDVGMFIKIFLENKDVTIFDYENIPELQLEEYAGVKRYYEMFQLKNSIAVPFYYMGKLTAVLVIEYVKEKILPSEDDLEFLRILGNQVGAAFSQIQLYNTIKQTTANQNAILNNMPFMVWLKDKNSVLLAANEKFAQMCKTTAENLIGKTDFDFFPKENAEAYVLDDKKVIEKMQTINTEEIIVGQEGPMWHETIKSPVFDNKGDVIGTTGMARDITNRKEAEQELLRSQEKIIKAAQRETTLRKVIEAVRSSLNLAEVKRKVTEEIGKAFNADRCYFRYYDKVKGEFVAPDVEYLSSSAIKSLLGVEPDQEGLKYFIEELNKRKKGFYPIVVNEEFAKGTPIERYFASGGIKADYAMPIIDRNDKLIWLVLHYSKEDPKLGEEEKQLLETIAYQIDIAFEQLTLFEETQKQAERETLLRGITEKIRSSLDIEETFSFICFETAKLFNVQRTAISSFIDPNDYEKYILRKEYTFSTAITGINDVGQYSKLSAFWGESLVSKDGLLAFDNIEESGAMESFKKIYADMGVKSIIGTAIKKGNDIWGILILSEYDKYRCWTDEEKLLLKAIASQVYIAVNQAELFEKEKKTAERETILRNIIEIIRSSFDVNEVKHEMVVQIGLALKADRVAFADYDYAKGNYFTAEGNEYRSNPDVKTFVGYDFTSTPGFISSIRELHLAGKDIIFSDLDKYIEETNLEDKEIELFYRNMGFMSSMATNINYGEHFYGNLVVTYEKKCKINERDIEFIKTLANQAGIAIHQAELFENEKRTAERETIIREIIETILGTLDINEVKRQIVTEIGKAFDAERCIIHQINKEIGKFIVIDEFSEYKALDNLISYVGIDIEKKPLRFFRDMFFSGKELLTPNWPEYLDGLNDVDQETKEWIDTLEIKSDYVFPIKFQNTLLAVLYMTYTQRYEVLSEYDLSSIRLLTNQIAIALHQAELFKQTQLQAQREKVIREIISEVSGTLDFNKIRKTLVNALGKALGSDFDILYLKDPDSDKFLPVDEYSIHLSSDEIESPVGVNIIEQYGWGDYFLSGKITDVFYSDIEDFKKDYNLYGTKGEEFLNRYNIKSSIVITIKHSDVLLGVLGINFVKDYKNITEDDINLVRIVAYQAGLALNQANLYKVTQLQAEREKISRNIIEILRSSMDKRTIIRLFVKNIGKFFGADRVFFSSYDPEAKMYLPVDEFSEYLSSPEVKSIVGFDWSDESVSEYIQPLLEKRELKIFCWDDYIKQNPKGQGFVSLFEDANVKSSYNLPVLYQEKIMGYFCIEFTKDTCHNLSDEDINRIRNMCTQTGIALYHAQLYVQAQETLQAHEAFIKNIAGGSKAILDNVIEISAEMSKTEPQCEEHIRHLNHINETVSKLLDLTNKIIDKSNPDIF